MKGGHLQEETNMRIFVATLNCTETKGGFLLCFVYLFSFWQPLGFRSKDVVNFVAVEGSWQPRGGTCGPAGSSIPRAGETPSRQSDNFPLQLVQTLQQ